MAILQMDLSGKNGLAKGFYSGHFTGTTPRWNLIYEAEEGQLAGGIYNPFRTPGYLNPANDTFDAVTGSIGLTRAIVYDATNDDTYFAENGTQLWQLTTYDDAALASIRTVAGAVLTDLEIYTVNGTKKLFYAYNKSGGGNIGMVDLPATTFSDTWFSGTASGGFTLSADGDIFMVPADNGRLYIFDKYEVHELNGTSSGGTNGTAQRMLAFPTYFVLTDALDYRGNIYMTIQSEALAGSGNLGATAPQVCGVYIWDRQSTAVKMRDFIPVKGIKEIRKIYLGSDNIIRILAITLERKTVIKKYTGTSFETVHELGPLAYPQYRDSVAVFPDYVTWVGVDGIIYANGLAPTSTKDSLFQIGTLATIAGGAPTAVGAIFPMYRNASTTTLVNSAGLFITYTASATSYVKRWVIHGTGSSMPIGSSASSRYVGNIYSPVKLIPPMSTVKKIVIYMAPIATTGSTTAASVLIFFNQSTSSWATKTVTYDDCAKGYIEIEVNKQYINAVQFYITYASGAVSAATDFQPYLALIDYQPTNTLK